MYREPTGRWWIFDPVRAVWKRGITGPPRPIKRRRKRA